MECILRDVKMRLGNKLVSVVLYGTNTSSGNWRSGSLLLIFKRLDEKTEEIMREILAGEWGAIEVVSTDMPTVLGNFIQGDPCILHIIEEGRTLLDEYDFFSSLKEYYLKSLLKPSKLIGKFLLERSKVLLSLAEDSLRECVNQLYWAVLDLAYGCCYLKGMKAKKTEEVSSFLSEAGLEDVKGLLDAITSFRNRLKNGEDGMEEFGFIWNQIRETIASRASIILKEGK